MRGSFDYFVVFAEMRTGSNFLESNLNALDGVACHGEAFNPHFIGYPNRDDLLGITREQRDDRPRRLLRAIRKMADGLNGFRFFHDHDPRILPDLLADPRCAKIVLTRNPVESYVSWKIAQDTGQWKLTNVARRKDSTAEFDAAEFETHLAQVQDFQILVQRGLQTTGQTAFYIGYEDLNDLEVMNGLANWLGVGAGLDALSKTLKRQNPEPLSAKVANFPQMQDSLARLDRFNLTRTPNFEPRRGPVVPGYLAGARTPLLYLPIPSGPEAAVVNWLCALDRVERDALKTRFTQGALRDWMAERSAHRSFTVIRHPLARAHAVFCARILPTGEGSMGRIRRLLQRSYGVVLPNAWPDASYDRNAHYAAFAGFLRFVRANLSGQTTVRVDGNWASQAQCLQGMAEFTLPDMIVREDEMQTYLPPLAMQAGHPAPPDPVAVANTAPFSLAEVHSAELEMLARDAYERDYVMFGFQDWG